MSKRLDGLWPVAVLAAAWLLAPLARADEVASGDGAQPPAPTGEVRCAIGMEKFLPADYYYCLATQNYDAKHYRDAARFFKEAASWASKPAQYVLGVMALNGDHQPVDRPLALAWFTLAAERHTTRFEEPYRALRATLSPEELQQAEQDLRNLSDTYADAVAATRAERRYHAGMTALLEEGPTASYCVAGQTDLSRLANAGGGAPSLASACSPMQQMVNLIDVRAQVVFENWGGHVEVGPLQMVK